MTFGNLIRDSKIFVGMIVTIIGLLLSWGVWATSSIFRQEGKQVVGTERDIATQQSVNEIKGDIKDFKGEVKQEFGKMRDKIDTNQEKVLDVLRDMDKRQKRIMEKVDK